MFYLHIPKTGGQTLASRLASAFAPGRVHMLAKGFRYPEDQARFKLVLSSHDFVESHITGNLLEEVEAPDTLVTVREPVAQIMSQFRHIRREPERRLARAARELSPGDFFDHFGDFFADHQARYLVSAFHPLDVLTEREGYWQALGSRLLPVLDRIRWLVPTDAIDRFVPLWERETGRLAANPAQVVNTAPADDVDLAALEAAVRERPHLYAFDNLLYHYARDRFARWEAEVEGAIRPWAYPDNASKAWSATDESATDPALRDCGVWLRRGWYAPEDLGGQPGWWAGPGRRADVHVLRGAGQDRLEFDVRIVNGITYEEVSAFAAQGFRPLRVWRRQLAEGCWRYSVNLASLPRAADVALVVPDCYAPINVFPDDPGLERRSFMATGWALAQAKAGEAPAPEVEAEAAA